MQITLLVAEMNVIGEENRELKSMLNSMSIKYNDLQKHLKFLVQQRKGKVVDQVCYIGFYLFKDG